MWIKYMKRQKIVECEVTHFTLNENAVLELQCFNTGIINFMSQQMWIVDSTFKQLSHFVKTYF